MPDRHTLAETEKAMNAHVSGLALNLPAAAAVSSLYRAANAVRLHLTNTVLREHGLTWTGFVVLWVVWIWRRRRDPSRRRERGDLQGHPDRRRQDAGRPRPDHPSGQRSRPPAGQPRADTRPAKP